MEAMENNNEGLCSKWMPDNSRLVGEFFFFEVRMKGLYSCCIILPSTTIVNIINGLKRCLIVFYVMFCGRSMWYDYDDDICLLLVRRCSFPCWKILFILFLTTKLSEKSDMNEIDEKNLGHCKIRNIKIFSYLLYVIQTFYYQKAFQKHSN